jgi:hypothetical protein
MILMVMMAEGLFGGRQDPYGEVSMGDGSSWLHTTEVREDAGSSAEWSGLGISGEVAEEAMKTGAFVLRAKDKSDKDGKDKVIGLAQLDTTALLSQPNVWVDLIGPLSHKDSEDCGRYSIRVRYRSDHGASGAATVVAAAESTAAPDDSRLVSSLSAETAASTTDAIAKSSDSVGGSPPEEREAAPDADKESDAAGVIEIRDISVWNLKNTGERN